MRKEGEKTTILGEIQRKISPQAAKKNLISKQKYLNLKNQKKSLKFRRSYLSTCVHLIWRYRIPV